MAPVTVLMLSLSMSVDAFAVAIGRGTAVSRPRVAEALRTALIFGAVEATTPFLGWLAGIAAAGWIASFDHWIAFLLLCAVGLHMIFPIPGAERQRQEPAGKPSLPLLLATAVGTSIDAMAVGLSLALIEIDLMGILVVCAAVGATTMVLAFLGMLLGRVIGTTFGRGAEVAAGVMLCLIGVFILHEHGVGF